MTILIDQLHRWFKTPKHHTRALFTEQA